MSPVVVILIILGIIFIFASYTISATLENNEEDEEEAIKIPKELSDEQKEKIDKMISDYMEENVDGRLSDIEAKLSEIVNQKTLALGDYAVTVNEEIERNHSEVMFLYSMLSDKQKEIMTTATMVDEYRKDMEAFISAKHISIEDPREHEDEEALYEAIKEIDENIAAETPEEEVKPVDSSKDVILELYKSGLSILEIAKHLGLGVGEVKLVVDLYQGVAKA